MALPGPSGRPAPKAVIFDLDEALLDRRRAWQFAIEEAVAVVSGRRVSATPLLEEYRLRPWSHALSVILDSPEERMRCARLCVQMFERSSLKRLLVHEGTGMGLDHLRAEAIEIGAISRERHNLALKQLQSTGLDKFVTVLATTPEGGEWSVASRISQCLAFLERSPGQVAFVSGEGRDLEAAHAEGAVVFEACWAAREATGFPAIYEPGEVAATVMRAWR